MPNALGEELLSLWEEFERGDTPEARFAAALDRAQPIFNNYYGGGGSWKEHGIKHSQVLARIAPVKDGCAPLYDHVRSLVEEGSTKRMAIDGNCTETKETVYHLPTILQNATELKASDIHIEPGQTSFRIRIRIDGRMQISDEGPMTEYSPDQSTEDLCGMDITEKKSAGWRFHRTLTVIGRLPGIGCAGCRWGKSSDQNTGRPGY